MRLTRIEINNFKNVLHGVIDFTNRPPEEGASITAIYGQNGSGKTALIDAIQILKILLEEKPIPQGTANKITVGEKSAHFVFSFETHVDLDDDEASSGTYNIDYEIEFQKADSDDADCSLIKECLYYSLKSDNGNAKKRHIACQVDLEKGISPKKVLKKVAVMEKYGMCPPDIDHEYILSSGKSYIFQRLGSSYILFEDPTTKIERFTIDASQKLKIRELSDPNLYMIISHLRQYTRNLMVISGRNIPSESSNKIMVFSPRVKFEGKYKIKSDPIEIKTSGGKMNSVDVILAKSTIAQVNLVLESLIPVHKLIFETEPTETEDVVKTYLYSENFGRKIPFECESYGIKKMAWVANVLIAAFNDEGFTAVIDELDAGVYEYLLGELLTTFEEYGHGQLIFTSHNLVPLEKLNYKSIVFTTTNQNNRYIPARYVKQTNNLRDIYLKSIRLGGEKEELSRDIDSIKISRAFRDANFAE
jgi:AAA15 family ATPase/GTPase